MKITINQFHSIGDIIFIEPIIDALIKRGHEVSLPVRDHLMWMASYFNHKDSFVAMSKAKDFEDHPFPKPDYIPLRFANQIYRKLDLNDHSDLENMMLDKYRLFFEYYGIECDWRKININFNHYLASQLHADLNLSKKEYVFINNMSQAGNINIQVSDPAEKIVYLSEMPGYTLFDWYIVFINAKEIHTVSTSILFVLQALYNKGYKLPPVYIYPRPNYDGLRGIKNLKFEYQYKLIEHV